VNRTIALAARLHSAALSLWALPALAFAQAQPPAESASPGPGEMATRSGSSGWAWVIAALVVLAIVWWALTTRRRGQVKR
jgi:bacteriorhodopsin